LFDGEVEIGSGFDLYGVGVHGDAYNGDEYGRPVEPEGYPVEVSCHLVREADDTDEAEASEHEAEDSETDHSGAGSSSMGSTAGSGAGSGAVNVVPSYV